MVVRQAREVAVEGRLTDLSNLSVIIPVLNEEKSIQLFLKSIQPLRETGAEVILVDGGSQDQTICHARPWIDKLVTSNSGRAIQMNAGAEEAKGQLFCFLHADTLLPKNVVSIFQQILEQGHIWGRFDVRLSGSRWMYRVISFMINRRSAWTGIATGDQAIFVRRNTFREVSGFPAIPLMEDIAISKKLKKFKAPYCVKSPVITSSRRWEVHGTWKTILLMWWIRWQYSIGVSPDKLRQQYYGAANDG